MTTALSFAALAAPSPSGTESPVTRRLANGLTVLVKEDHRFPLVSLRLYVHAGSAYEEAKQAGISHLLEHMVFKGTAKRPKGAVAAEVEKSGGYLNAATSYDYTFYLTDMTREHWKTGLDVLKDMAFNPTLDPDELEAEKDVVISELKRGEDSPGQRLFRATMQAALAGTPYERPIIGFEDTVRGISSQDMRAYIDRLYQPQSMLLVVCGDVAAEEVFSQAEQLFGDLAGKRGVTPPVQLKEPEGKDFSASVEKGPWNKVHLALALPAPGMNDARSPQLDVLAQILGGDATSRFYRTYKYEKRLVDSISVSNYSFERTGLIYIQATLDADKLIPFWQAFTKDMAKLQKTTFSREEIERAVLNIEDGLFRAKETLAGYASKLAFFTFFSGGEQGEENYLRIMNDTDQEVLLELAAEYFRPEAMSMVVLMPKDADIDALLPKNSPLRQGKTAPAWDVWFKGVQAANWPSEKKSLPDAGSQAAQAGQQEIIELGKGRTLVLMPDATLPYTAVNMVFTGGENLLSEKNQGLGAFTASLLTKGSKNRSATQMEDYLSDRAASLGASSGRHTFTVNMEYPARFAGDMFPLLAETLKSPAFAEEEAARVRQNQTAAITSREDQPTGLAFRRMFPFLFPGHSYGFLQLGEKDRVERLSSSDAAAFWKEQTKQPWVLGVCGSFGREAVLAAVESLPKPSAAEKESAVPQWGADKELRLPLPDRNQAHLLLVFPTVPYGHADEPGLELLQNILAGQSGLLFRDLRDKQALGYTVTAFSWISGKAGALIFYIGTEPAKLQQAKEGFAKVIAELHETPLAASELDRGKNQMEGDYYRGRQTLNARSAEAATLLALHRPVDAARKLVQEAQSVNAETLQELARKYLVFEKAYAVTVEP